MINDDWSVDEVINNNKIILVPNFDVWRSFKLIKKELNTYVHSSENEDYTICLDNWLRLIVTAEPKNAHGNFILWFIGYNKWAMKLEGLLHIFRLEIKFYSRIFNAKFIDERSKKWMIETYTAFEMFRQPTWIFY